MSNPLGGGTNLCNVLQTCDSMDIDIPQKKGTVRFGTSSFSEKSWVGVFYSQGMKPDQYLSFYSYQFDTVEIDSTYYGIPKAETVQKWADATPETFLFAAKFPRSIVHGGEKAIPDANVLLNPEMTYGERDVFLERMQLLGPRLGPLLLQFPYFNKSVFSSPKAFYEKLDRFLEDLPKKFRYAVEVRNKWWLNATLAEICKRHKVTLTLVDQAWMPHGDEVTKFDPVTNDLMYIRLLGDRKKTEALTDTYDREVIDYSDRLQRWAKLIIRIRDPWRGCAGLQQQPLCRARPRDHSTVDEVCK